jgi:hypothetical protein
VLALVLEHQPDGPLPQLLRIPPLSGHGSNLSRVEASRNPGAVQWSSLQLNQLAQRQPRGSYRGTEGRKGRSPSATSLRSRRPQTVRLLTLERSQAVAGSTASKSHR